MNSISIRDFCQFKSFNFFRCIVPIPAVLPCCVSPVLPWCLSPSLRYYRMTVNSVPITADLPRLLRFSRCPHPHAALLLTMNICVRLLSEGWVREGHLQLRTAFSRDQTEKVYVQDLIRSDAGALWRLLDADKAHLYVCGDARHMAGDVHHALLDILRQEAGLSDQLAGQYLSDLETAGRYQREAWVT